MGLTNNYATALSDWLNGFAKVYREPVLKTDFEDSEYITYFAETGNFNSEFIQAITIYTKSTGYSQVMNIVDEIEEDIGECGKKISGSWGYMTIYKGSPFYQDKPDEDDTIRAGYVNLLIRVYQNNVGD